MAKVSKAVMTVKFTLKEVRALVAVLGNMSHVAYQELGVEEGFISVLDSIHDELTAAMPSDDD